MQLGTHIIIDAVYKGNLDDIAIIQACFDGLCDLYGMTVLNRYHHLFDPQGLTCVYTLSESHLSIHTWPEHQRFCADLFTCSKDVNVDEIVETLSKGLGVTQSRVRVLSREVLSPGSSPMQQKNLRSVA